MTATAVAKWFTTRSHRATTPTQLIALTTATSERVQLEEDRGVNSVFLRETEIPSWHLF